MVPEHLEANAVNDSSHPSEPAPLRFEIDDLNLVSGF
jgi:hypothetical protein